MKLLEEFEKITFEQLGKEVAKRWHKLSAKDRVPYQKRSRLDKERFKREMEAYKIKLALKEKFMEQTSCVCFIRLSSICTFLCPIFSQKFTDEHTH